MEAVVCRFAALPVRPALRDPGPPKPDESYRSRNFRVHLGGIRFTLAGTAAHNPNYNSNQRSNRQAADSGEVELCMSWINVAEAFYILARRVSPTVAGEFIHRLPSLPIRIVLSDEEGIMAVARVKAAHPIAFGDSFAIALAQAEQASVITGDDEIRRCGLVPVDWIGT